MRNKRTPFSFPFLALSSERFLALGAVYLNVGEKLRAHGCQLHLANTCNAHQGCILDRMERRDVQIGHANQTEMWWEQYCDDQQIVSK